MLRRFNVPTMFRRWFVSVTCCQLCHVNDARAHFVSMIIIWKISVFCESSGGNTQSNYYLNKKTQKRLNKKNLLWFISSWYLSVLTCSSLNNSFLTLEGSSTPFLFVIFPLHYTVCAAHAVTESYGNFMHDIDIQKSNLVCVSSSWPTLKSALDRLPLNNWMKTEVRTLSPSWR